MSIAKVFSGSKAFIPYIICGDPDLETTVEIIKSLEKGGADMVLLGIPFSDPTAEGPINESANMRALKNGATTDLCFEMVKNLEIKIPVVLMTYANVVFSYGTDRFLQKAAQAGACGLVLPDVPYEEREEFSASCENHGIQYITIVATNSEERRQTVAKGAKGFIYCISLPGEDEADIDETVSIIRNVNDIPCAVCCDVETETHAKRIAAKADGIITDSAVVKIVAKHQKDSPQKVYEYISKIKNAIK